MLSSIHPFGERARNSRWGITVTAYIVGALAGGVVAGAMFGAAGFILAGFVTVAPVTVAVAALVVVVAGLALDSGLLGSGVPTIRRQVNEDWLNAYRGWVYGVGFGFQLGFGLDVIVTSAAVYAMFVIALLTGSPLAGAAIGAVFGLTRGVAILGGAGVSNPDLLRAFHRRLQGKAGWARRLVLATEAGLAGVIVLALFAGGVG